MSSQPAEKPRDVSPPSDDVITDELPLPMEPQEIREGHEGQTARQRTNPKIDKISGGAE